MKEELGLDHFEGRSWQGLHRHALMTMNARSEAVGSRPNSIWPGPGPAQLRSDEVIVRAAFPNALRQFRIKSSDAGQAAGCRPLAAGQAEPEFELEDERESRE